MVWQWPIIAFIEPGRMRGEGESTGGSKDQSGGGLALGRAPGLESKAGRRALREKSMDGWDGTWVGLVGMSGVGKTSSGTRLAQMMGWRFIDLDQAAAELAGQDLNDIFQAEGEAGFRRWELRALEMMASMGPAVVALGAGAPTWGPTREMILRERGRGARVVWLDEEDGVIARRLGKAAGRPLLAGAADMKAAVARQRLARQEAYGEVSGQRVCAGGTSPEKAAALIAVALGVAWRSGGPGGTGRGGGMSV